MSANKVALFGHNSGLGRTVIHSLLTHHTSTTLKVYHRAGSKTSDIPFGIDKVQIDYDDEAGLASSLKGIDVVVSTIGTTGISSNVLLGRAAKSAGVCAFIPAYYTSHPVRTAEERKQLEVNGAPHVAAVSQMREDLEKLGIPMCLVANGMFIYPAMAFGFTMPSVVRGVAEFYGNAASIPYPLTSQDYLGAGIAEIASSFPSSIVGRTIALIECTATGQEMVDVIERVTGKPVTITRLTDEVVEERTRNVAPPPTMTPMACDAYFKRLWGQDRVLKSDDIWEVKSVPKQSLEQLVREVKKLAS